MTPEAFLYEKRHWLVESILKLITNNQHTYYTSFFFIVVIIFSCLCVYLFTCFNQRTTGQILWKYEHYAITSHPKLLPFNFLQLRIMAWMMHKFVRWERYYWHFWNQIIIATTSTTMTKVSVNTVDVIVKATHQTGWSRSIDHILDLYWGKAWFKSQSEQQISWLRLFCGFAQVFQTNARLEHWLGHNCFFPIHQSCYHLVV